MSAACRGYIETELSKDEVHVWPVAVDAHLSVLDYYFSLLSFEEIQKAKSYIFQNHANHFVVRRAILRLILSYYLDVPPQKIAIHTGENGKPYLSGCKSNIYFNLSHSNGYVYYAISSQFRIGIDIECMQEQLLKEDLASFVLHPEELKFFDSLASHQKNDFFYRYWSQKEALVKATGSGLVIPLSNIHVEFSDHRAPCLISFTSQECTNNWSLSLLETPSNYVGYMALNGPLNCVKYKRFLNNGCA